MPLMKHTDACMLAHGQGCPHATGCAPAVEHHFRAAARAVRQLHGLQAHHLGAGPPMGSLMDGLGAELRASAVGKGGWSCRKEGVYCMAYCRQRDWLTIARNVRSSSAGSPLMASAASCGRAVS